MNLFDQITLLLTGLTAVYAIWILYGQHRQQKELHNIYYAMAFAVIFVSGVLLIFLGYGILASPLILTVATLIPLGISLGIMNQYFTEQKRLYSWFALIGLLAIAGTSLTGSGLKAIAVPLFHGVAGLIIFLGPLYLTSKQKAAPGFWWVSVGGVLISLGGMALAFLNNGNQLLFFSAEVVFAILAPLLLLMTLGFFLGLRKTA